MSAPAENAVPLVLVEDVHTYYGKSHILHGVSLHVGPGEVVGLLGRNGVGKSTTLKTIMGLVRPSHGVVLLDGNAITGLAPHKLARLGIGYVPEDRRIFRLLTVMENLRTGLDRDGVTEDKRRALLDKVFTNFPVLAERRNQAGGTLSGGEQQMLAIARAMMLEPKISVRPEATNARIMPVTMPLIVWIKIWSSGIDWKNWATASIAHTPRYCLMMAWLTSISEAAQWWRTVPFSMM